METTVRLAMIRTNFIIDVALVYAKHTPRILYHRFMARYYLARAVWLQFQIDRLNQRMR